MFPYTHICFARDVLGALNTEIVLGAVFPDTVIAGFLEHPDTHGRCGEIHRYLSGVGIFEDFAQAVVTHGITPQGLDYYCDEKYRDFSRGYAFEMALPLVDKVVDCCRLPEKMGWWKAHNFIEMAAELWLYNNRRDYHGYLAKALDNRNMILAISQVLAPFYGIPVGKMVMSFPIYGEYVLMDEVTPAKLAGKYAGQMNKKHGIAIDAPAAAEVIREAETIVAKTFPDFIEDCREKVGELIKTIEQ